jgi:NADP-reducing hydrogenase subunit HndB
MEKIRSLADLKKIRDEKNKGVELRKRGEDADKLVQVKVAMATCGIASGAKETMEFLADAL